MKIKVTKKHIKEGENTVNRCPVALALMEIERVTWVSVGMMDVLLEIDEKDLYYFELPEAVVKFIEICDPDSLQVSPKARPIGFTLGTDIIANKNWSEIFTNEEEVQSR